MSTATAAQTRPVEGLLRFALKIDAAASAAIGLTCAVLGAVLDDLLGIPIAVTLPVGILLLGYAGFVWFVASRPRVPAAGAWPVIAINAGWVLVSGGYAAAAWSTLTAVGAVVVLAQAAAVLGLADLQYLGLRRATS